MEAQKRERERDSSAFGDLATKARCESIHHFIFSIDLMGFLKAPPLKKTKQTEALNIGEGTAKEGGTC